MRDSFKELTLEELINKRDLLIEESRKNRYDMVIGHVDNPLKKRTLRRKISRINTIIHEFHLGIRKHIEKKSQDQGK